MNWTKYCLFNVSQKSANCSSYHGKIRTAKIWNCQQNLPLTLFWCMLLNFSLHRNHSRPDRTWKLVCKTTTPKVNKTLCTLDWLHWCRSLIGNWWLQCFYLRRRFKRTRPGRGRKDLVGTVRRIYPSRDGTT